MIFSSVGSGHRGKYSYEIHHEYLKGRRNLSGKIISIKRNHQFNLVSFFQIVISLLAYVATLSGQLYFGKSYFFTLFESNYFDTTVTFSEQLFLENSCIYSPFSEQPLFCKSFFFRNNFLFGEKLLPSYNTILCIIVPCYNSHKKIKNQRSSRFEYAFL